MMVEMAVVDVANVLEKLQRGGGLVKQTALPIRFVNSG